MTVWPKPKTPKKNLPPHPPGPLLAPNVPQMCPATPPTPPVRVHGIPGPCQIHTCEMFLENTEYMGQKIGWNNHVYVTPPISPIVQCDNNVHWLILLQLTLGPLHCTMSHSTGSSCCCSVDGVTIHEFDLGPQFRADCIPSPNFYGQTWISQWWNDWEIQLGKISKEHHKTYGIFHM